MSKIVLDKDTKYSIQLFLYKNVQNLPEVRKQYLNSDLNCCLINPSLILHTLHIALAANKSVKNKLSNNLYTKNLSSELLSNLYHTRNITKALKTFGSAEEDTACLLVVFESESEPAVSLEIDLKGDLVDIGELKNITDSSLIKKTYEINDQELENSTLEDCVLSRIAIKDLDLNR